jgi:hypothetical protein
MIISRRVGLTHPQYRMHASVQCLEKIRIADAGLPPAAEDNCDKHHIFGVASAGPHSNPDAAVKPRHLQVRMLARRMMQKQAGSMVITIKNRSN